LLRTKEEGGVLICDKATLEETFLFADNIGAYLKANFHNICEKKGQEDTKAGICFVVSVITSEGWALDVQEASQDYHYASPHISFNVVEGGSRRMTWGSWSNTVGNVGPTRQSS
jgi:hypothetical protein